MELYGWRTCKCCLFQQLQECRQPQVLVDVDCCPCNASWGAYQMALSLDTSMRCFVRFWLSTSNAENGCPSVGVISKSFAVFCDPYTGRIRQLRTSQQESCNKEGVEMQAQDCLAAEVLGWESWAEATAESEGCRAGFGMLLSNGSIEFIRQEKDSWKRSGVVLDQLPEKVRCCAGLMGFVGQTFISVEEVCVNESQHCLDDWAKGAVVGKISEWTALPSA
mmetsp:Transcript_45934/g.73309  ORF Transcript_45934/g.73309 Transcript_45934/m.73309 type:complete len:221 (+) Transcript_45934:3-665(+)